MKFPQELCDSFIDHLHDDRESLESCSLVCKTWVPPSRYHLFESIQLSSRECLVKWSQTFDTSEQSPSHLVKRLSIAGWLAPDALAGLLEHFRSFDNVRELILRRVDFNPFHGKPLEVFFGHFVSSVRWLEFNWAITAYPSDLIHLVWILTNVDDFGIMGLHGRSEGFDEMPDRLAVSPSFRGRLRLSTNTHTAEGFIKSLVSLPNGVDFRSLNLWFENAEDFRHTDKLLCACADRLETLEIGYEFFGEPSSSRLVLNAD